MLFLYTIFVFVQLSYYEQKFITLQLFDLLKHPFDFLSLLFGHLCFVYKVLIHQFGFLFILFLFASPELLLVLCFYNIE